MKHCTLKHTPAYTEAVVSHYTCDICKYNHAHVRDGTFTDDVVIQHEDVDHEQGVSITKSVDLCGSCFTTKVIPLLESLGVEMHVKEKHWETWFDYRT